jgi:hypothetical protein
MNTPAPAAKTYDLYFLLDGTRFFWRNPNHGVTITDAGRASSIDWRPGGGFADDSRLWTDIVEVGLMAATDGRAAVNQCRIRFRDGRAIVVTDCGEDGRLDESRTPVYRDFVRALHARLAAAPEGTVKFTAGVTEGRHKAMQVILVIAVLFFVGTPFVLLFIVRDWRVLLTLAAGAAFVWPFWKVTDNNRPRSYDPRRPPGELME